MIDNLLNLLSYSQYVWISFGITFLLCGILYYKTLKKLKKYENEFTKDIIKLKTEDRKIELNKSKVSSQVFVAKSKSV